MINNLENLKNFFNEKVKSSVFFIHPNVNFGIGLEKIINNFHIICSRKSDLVKQLSDNGVSVFCLDDNKIRNSAEILRNKKTINFINRINKETKSNYNKNKKNQNGITRYHTLGYDTEQPLIITFKPSPALEKICAENNFKYLGNDWKLNRELENKIKFNEVLKKLKISSAESEVINADKIDYQQLKNKFGKNFIVQFPRGFSGNGTFLITPWKKIPLTPFSKRGKMKISKFIKGPTVTLNACLLKSGLVASQLFYQITGEKKLNRNILGSCGNDFAVDLKLDKKTPDKIYSYTKKIGEYLKTLNYKGIFGLDFMVDENNQEVHLIEINPRLTASIPVFTKLQIRNGELPFLALHILEFLKLDYISGLKSSPQSKNNFSQLILRNILNSPVKISKNIPSGIYKIKNNKLKFIKTAYCLESLNIQDEFLVQCLSAGNIVNPNIEYANVQVNDGVVNDDFKLRDKVRTILKLLFKEIKLKKFYSPLGRG